MVYNLGQDEADQVSGRALIALFLILSWVVVIALWQQILGGAGVFNQLLRNAGFDVINIMNNPATFKLLVVAESIWKNAGWGGGRPGG